MSPSLYLVYVKPVTANEEEKKYEYDLFFSETPDIVYGADWDDDNPATAKSEDLTPDKTTYSKIERVVTDLPLKTIQETSCYSMEYAINGSVALSWINIENLEEYPEKGRLVFHFGDTYEKVKEGLGEFNYFLYGG